MPRKQKKYHYLYKTTNLINNKFYVGMHSTDNLEDGYLGSGKRLRYSIAKYGKENFKIEYLKFFEDRKTLVEREKNLVNEELLKDPLCMNIMQGGNGGFISIEQQYKRAQAGGLGRKKNQTSEQLSAIGIKAGNSVLLKKVGIFNPLNTKFIDGTFWTGKKHNDKTKSIMSEKASLRVGDKNSQFGTCWITNNIENKKIKKEELETWLKTGWRKGRIGNQSSTARGSAC